MTDAVIIIKMAQTFSFRKLSIWDYRDKPHFFAKRKLLSSQNQMNTFLKDIYQIERRRCDRNLHNTMKIPVGIYQTTKRFFSTDQTNNACKLEFADHL